MNYIDTGDDKYSAGIIILYKHFSNYRFEFTLLKKVDLCQSKYFLKKVDLCN